MSTKTILILFGLLIILSIMTSVFAYVFIHIRNRQMIKDLDRELEDLEAQ